MRKFVIVSVMLVSGLSIAEDLMNNVIKVTRQAEPVRVLSVTTRTVGEHGFPSTQVFATATFSNSCYVPKTNEVVSMTQYAGHRFETLILNLGSESRRMCPAVYRPVTVTFDLGVHTKPNDGFFSKILVNGVEAK